MKKLLLAAVVCCLALPILTFAQTINATLGGTVSDATGALIPGVTITATNLATGIVTPVVTNEAGAYNFASIQSGTYKVTAELPGFQTQTYNNVNLGVSQQVRLNFTLQVGTITQSVEVSVPADNLIATSSSSVGSVLPDSKIKDLPLIDRNVLGLVSTQPGVQMLGMAGGGDLAAPAIFAGTRGTNVNTSRDGISVNDTRHNDSGGFAVTYTSPDLVEEVRVIVAAADAEPGRGGGQVQMATRSGTNQYRGSVFYTNRNSALDFQGNPVTPAGAKGPLSSFSVFNRDPNRPTYDASGWVQMALSRMPKANDFTVGDGLNTAGARWTRRRRDLDDVTGSSPNIN